MKILSNNKIYELTDDFKLKDGDDERQLAHEKFQLLFQYGVLAYLDGYYRESVSSIMASLERFFEVIIQTISGEFKIDKSDFTKTWGIVKKQSERQVGAYFFLYLLKMKHGPKDIYAEKIQTTTKKTISHFRNEVIHNGYFPTKEETFELIKIIFEYITTTIKELYPEKTLRENLYKEIKKGLSINIMIELSSEKQKDFETSLKSLINTRHLIHLNG